MPINEGLQAKAKLAESLNLYLSLSEAAALLDLSYAMLKKVIASGHVPQDKSGGVYLVPLVRGYNDMLREANKQHKTPAAQRVQEARAKALEFKLEQDRREVINIDDACTMVDLAFGPLKSELMGIPARITRDLELRKQIEIEIDGALSRTCDRIAQSSDDVRSGREIAPAIKEDDPGQMGERKSGLPRKRGAPRTPQPILDAV